MEIREVLSSILIETMLYKAHKVTVTSDIICKVILQKAAA